MAVIELPCGMLVGLSIRYRQVPLWMGPFMDISCREPTGFNRNRIWMYDLCQTSFSCTIEFGSTRNWMYDLCQTSFSCTIGFGSNRSWMYGFAKQAFRVPSDSAQAVVGCIICARQAFTHHPIWRQAKKDGKNARNVPEKRTGKL